MRKPDKGPDQRRGAAMVEFTFCVILLLPLLLGTLVFGFRLIRSIQMSQITRDIGHMYLKAVDFRNAGPKASAQTLSTGFDLVTTGRSLIVLSKVKLIQQADCDIANAPGLPPGNPCANLNKTVFMEQLTMGNTAVGGSAFGTPTSLRADFTISLQNQGLIATNQTSNFDAILLLKGGELAYICEMINLTPDLNVPGLSGLPQVYARTIF